jgi:hypothetical protein
MTDGAIEDDPAMYKEGNEVMGDTMTENQRIMHRLIHRSPDIGEGWRQVSDTLWRHVLAQAHPDLTELDENKRRVRFTAEGETIMMYAL